MAKLVAEKLGGSLRAYRDQRGQQRSLELNGKGIDVVWNGMTITTAAQESWTAPFYCNNAQVIVTK